MSPNLLPHLETFAEAAERGNFTAAARHLGISQAAVSQRIQQLQAALNTPLFRRAAGRAVLTDAGRRLHDYARRILDLMAEAVEAVTGTPAEVAGDLRLAASSVPGEHLLPPVLAAFRRRHPAVRVRVTVSDTDAVLREVERGEVHLGFVGGRADTPELDFQRFATDELVLVVPRGHPWWRKRRVTAAELAGQALVVREAGSGSRQCLERALDRAGVPVPAFAAAVELGSTEAIKEAVCEGLGVAVLSRRAVAREVRAGHLKPLRVEGVSFTRDLYVVRDRRRVLPVPARCFLHLLNPSPAQPATV